MKEISLKSLTALTSFRKKLHQFPELAGEESRTSAFIVDHLKKLPGLDIQAGLGGYGILASLDSGKPGPSVMFRSELDAIPIQEANTFGHRSRFDGISHKCGHDGHSTILYGLAQLLSRIGLKSGKVYFLFQPAEETGVGARAILNDPKWPSPEFDYVFAIHNVPGFPLGSVICKEGTITPTVSSLAIHLQGLTSHAGQPELGKNPDEALMELLERIKKMRNPDKEHPEYLEITTIHLNLGHQDYGVSPARAELHFTLRCFNSKFMEEKKQSIGELISELADRHELEHSHIWLQEFHSNSNETKACEFVYKAATDMKLNVVRLEQPFPWGEDFGLFTHSYKGAIFGLGAGENHPPLHAEIYDFPDPLIPVGIEMFYHLFHNIQQNFRAADLKISQ